VIVDEKGIKDSWNEYTEKLMNEEKNSPERGLRSSPDLDPDLG